MNIHHVRNATMVIETKDKVVLIDPMLSKRRGTGPSFTFFRYKPKRNPIVNLPDNAMDLVNRTTHCLITHLHPDHLDDKAVEFLKTNNTPIICSVKDEKALLKKGLNVSQTVDYWASTDFLGGTIEGIPARHGYGYIAKPMGNVMGYYIKLPDEKSIYLSSDTIYTDDVDKVLKEYKPDISVVASGRAQLDLFQPLLMKMEDIVKFTKNAPGQVIANHLEAVNHCPITREELRVELTQNGLIGKTFIPEDGETMTF